MNLSSATRYAVHALAYLASRKETGKVTGAEIATTLGQPFVYTSKALHLLERAGVIRSARGQGGGYQLARPADEITLLEIVEGVDGLLTGDAALSNGGATGADRKLQALCDEIAEAARGRLAKVRLSDLAGKTK